MRFEPSLMMSQTEIRKYFKEEVSACPFCHAHAGVLYYCTQAPHITCLSCGADGPIGKSDKGREHAQYQAIKLWNNRTARPPLELSSTKAP